MKSVLLLAAFLVVFSVTAQTIQISGSIKDAQSGESLIGATIVVKGTTTGTATNDYGFYSFAVPAGPDSISLFANYIGYTPVILRILPRQNQKLDIKLSDNSIELGVVEIEADSYQERLKSTEMSVSTISVKEAKLLPALFGEVDILKTLQLKPGINGGSEGNSALYVRGGGADQNLIVLDEAVVYNASHLFGFFSTFNPDAVKDVKLYKGGFPAQYGGRLSSVIDVKLKEGNNQTFHGSGGIGLIASRLTLEGPIVKNKGSFIVSGRRTYADVFTRAINRANDRPGRTPIPDYYFYDLNAKLNYQITDRDRIYASAYFGRDVFGFNGSFFDFDFSWGNGTGTVRWNHIYNPKLFSNTTLTYSNYTYDITNRVLGFSFNLGSNIEDTNLKHDFYYTHSNKHTLKFGVQATRHYIVVGRLKAGSDDGSISFQGGNDFNAFQTGAYVSNDWKINNRMRAEMGFRISGFNSDSTWYGGFEPRAALNYQIGPRTSVKASYARMFQYLHLVSNSGISLPTDIWYPSTRNVEPERSDQLALGWSQLLGSKYYLNHEVYYKWLQNQVDFIDHAELFANPQLETQFAFGDGYAYGTEIEIEKREGKLTGWIGYTLAYIRRGNFDNIMDGRYFAPRYDRRHNATVVAIYKISPRFSATGAWVYGSGDLSWLPGGRFSFQDASGGAFQPLVPAYGDRNTFRLPAYHRLDLGLVYNLRPKWGKSDLTLSVYNAYDRRNPYFVYLEPELQTVNIGGQDVQFPNRIAAKQVSLFPVIPTITWNFEF
jgi:hypothetical protein